MSIQNNNSFTGTDQEIVLLTLENKENYQYLVQRYENKLLRYIIRISGLRADDAQDVLQNVFVKVYKNLNDFDANLKFSSWIYRIAHNETISHFRKMNTRPKVLDSETSEVFINIIKDDLNIKSDLEKSNLKEIVQKMVSSLDKKYKEVIILKYMEDMDYQEVSDILKKPIGTVATLLKKAKEQLKQEILKNKMLFQEYV